MIDIQIVDADGTTQKAKVTRLGQLVVAPIEYSSFYNVKADTINTGFNLVGPKSSMCFVITSIFLYADKGVGANDATVIIYEADSPTTATVSKTLFQTEMLKQTYVSQPSLNIIITTGKWINVKTDDNSIYANISGYYVKS